MIGFTDTQVQRLKELGGDQKIVGCRFSSVADRDEVFETTVKNLVEENREKLRRMAHSPSRCSLFELEDRLASTLVGMGFMEVATPMLLSASNLKKMGIDESHPLWEQVFWVDKKRCMRPMLAPNLYFLLKHLKRNIKKPVRIFEIGPCFRKESQGSRHLEEFTMLNLVELAPDCEPTERLTELIEKVMGQIGLEYRLKNESSEVYGNTVDVEVDGVEVASGAVGPHFLDGAYGITDAWVGVGFGLERLLMVMEGHSNIRKVGRSLVYLNGARIDI
ncbi:pyrrolysine--tRNA(Pyl) ligase large subunit [Methermicoccus shengliensis]|uniref:Pyrrolysine--tRNA(Pyl) ligase large subunit n=1 Tax=Methermicoccus shengliensis TaxID=660064 RepID=A0A832RV45_9EURY|nr:pyrrolysine--tRNA(Pyl) ligase large subunit [Methermicoccus shengliensis]KUK04055.1 MAG: Pyrrolysyl-tRNA synthetase [Euryarchaeota archaeon 55_53]MDI3488606.1 hypothetical protein [Methanosarcinales archaeon]MDN5295620.1 hypothetical protein [Methanosarcinales archaeon]HIH69922.1 pyrrolysine--tRNA(Pyl) ligase large subunit [Methermicoccus shengliensis]